MSTLEGEWVFTQFYHFSDRCIFFSQSPLQNEVGIFNIILGSIRVDNKINTWLMNGTVIDNQGLSKTIKKDNWMIFYHPLIFAAKFNESFAVCKTPAVLRLQ